VALTRGAARHCLSSDLVIAPSFEQRFGVRAIGLVATNVAMDIVRRQETNRVAEWLELPAQ
jgi:hypothetical protein